MDFKPKNKRDMVKTTEKDKQVAIGGAFACYNLSIPILKAIKAKGYNLPTPIQRKAIPAILQGFNVIAMARTGSGKTGAFIIPAVERL
jgi:ATP-dependent RNA helicase DDX54/DBP10